MPLPQTQRGQRPSPETESFESFASGISFTSERARLFDFSRPASRADGAPQPGRRSRRSFPRWMDPSAVAISLRVVSGRIPDDPLSFIQRCVRKRSVFWTYHVNMRLEGRSIPRQEILDAVDS